MEKQKYIMIGAPIITKEIFRNVLRPLNNYDVKPNGGFWSSKYISNIGNISDWFTYLQEASSIARYKNMNQSTIFTLKDTAKILVIDNPKQVLTLATRYPSNHQILGYLREINSSNIIFDFEKLSQDYDGVYINFNAFLNQMETTVFDRLGSNSLLLFNLDCIENYQIAPIIFNIDNPYSFPYIIPETISSPQKIEEESYEHKALTKLTQELYLELISTKDSYSFRDYDEYLTVLTQNIKILMEIIKKDEDKRISEIKKYLESKKMHIDKEHIIQTFALNYLSEYLRRDEQRIKTLEKSKVRTPKSYSIY